MAYKKDEFIETASEAEKLVLSIVRHSGAIKATRLQKISLIAKALIDGKVTDSHGAYFFGGYSDDIDEETENMRVEGYIGYVPGKGFVLTEDGKVAFLAISNRDRKIDEVVKTVTSALRNLSDKEVTAVTYGMFPQLTGKSLIKEEITTISSRINLETLKLNEVE
ncbi:MAG: hypothetical protein ACYCT2_04700 [Thermoplasmataceae archaeon]